ncbi:MAG: hypothetical protein GY819_13025 [Planctomycetaceae bacterium]|nr:hypothetical protein [Planctomycetaceae bacterium]
MRTLSARGVLRLNVLLLMVSVGNADEELNVRPAEPGEWGYHPASDEVLSKFVARPCEREKK